MMRGASRLATRSLALPAQTCAAGATLTSSYRHFGSKYTDDSAQYRRPYRTESRSGAHRHPPRKEVMRAQRAAAAAAASSAVHAGERLHSEAAAAEEEEEEEVVAPRSLRTHYPEYSKKRVDERLAFTSNFREPDMKPILESARDSHSVSAKAPAEGVADDTDVTRIYSTEEVRSMAAAEAEGKPAGQVMASADDDVLDALSAGDKEGEALGESPANAAAPEASEAAPDAAATAVEEDEDDEFAEIRGHPFFKDMLRRVERNMIRFRKETRAYGRYSLEAVDECVRPLLQLTDYPLTATQLSHLSHSISPAVLKSSLRDRASCRRLQLYRSQDTDLLLDWSVEDFLRRRYESVHLSWEPMDVICRRFGWTEDMLTDRDYLLYFSAFPDYVELAELKATGSGEPKAVLIEDPVARAAEGPIPAKKLLLRRKAGAETEPSLTESIRLMGSAAVTTPAKGRKAQRLRQHGGDSVSDYFDAVEAAVKEVDGDEQAKLLHAAETVPPLRQASHPGGRTIREFSLPKSHATAAAEDGAAEAAAAAPSPAPSAAPGAEPAAFDQKGFEELSSAYHNAKVENSLLRRRLLDTDNVDKAQEMQAQFAKGRNEILRMEQELERMRELKRFTAGTSSASGSEHFQIPRGLPQYAEAPEFDRPVASKNDRAVEDIDDDEIEQALKDFKEEEELARQGKMTPAAAAATTAAAAARAAPHATATADAEEDEYEEVEVEVDDEDADLTAAEDVAAEELSTANDAVVEEPLGEPVAPVAQSPSLASLKAQHDKEWQDELEAAVEQQEAEQELEEEDEDFSADSTSDAAAAAVTPVSRLAQLASLHDRLSSAADRARRYLASVEERRAEVMAKLDCQLADASKKVDTLAERIAAVEQERARLQEMVALEEAERKAREVEAQLQAQRERRLAELEQERERARLAQEAAAQAMARQRQVEAEALAMEEELQRKLRDVQSRLRSLHEGNTGEAAAAAAESSDHHEPAAKVAATAPAPPPAAAPAAAPEADDEELSAAPASAGQFMCTPEQYDGLHLAAERLKKEIAALESQMEEEGDEDDETLMAVLAASRADLEELEECIASVRANATWATRRDARRAREDTLAATVSDTEAHRLQSAIDNHRFQISLLEKRLHHTSQRAVMNKLKDRIAGARKAISQLRMEQDRLRRAGRDAMGLPESVSIAETLAHEGRESEEAKAEAERAVAAAAAAGEEGEEAVGEEESALTTHEAAADVAADGEEDGEAAAVAAVEEGEASASRRSAPAVAASAMSDADKLRLRLDSMVGDIQHLQDSIEAQERSSDYDDDETEVVLREMKAKLSQLLRLRDQVQRALLEEASSERGSSGGGRHTPVIRPAAGAEAPTPVVHRQATPVRSAVASRHTPLRSAARKLRSATRGAGQRRR